MKLQLNRGQGYYRWRTYFIVKEFADLLATCACYVYEEVGFNPCIYQSWEDGGQVLTFLHSLNHNKCCTHPKSPWIWQKISCLRCQTDWIAGRHSTWKMLGNESRAEETSVKATVWRAEVSPYPWRVTGGAEIPERALLVTKWAHDNGASYVFVTYFIARIIKKKKI